MFIVFDPFIKTFQFHNSVYYNVFTEIDNELSHRLNIQYFKILDEHLPYVVTGTKSYLIFDEDIKLIPAKIINTHPYYNQLVQLHLIK